MTTHATFNTSTSNRWVTFTTTFSRPPSLPLAEVGILLVEINRCPIRHVVAKKGREHFAGKKISPVLFLHFFSFLDFGMVYSYEFKSLDKTGLID